VNLEAIERDLIQKAMAQAQNNKSVAPSFSASPAVSFIHAASDTGSIETSRRSSASWRPTKASG